MQITGGDSTKKIPQAPPTVLSPPVPAPVSLSEKPVLPFLDGTDAVGPNDTEGVQLPTSIYTMNFNRPMRALID